LPRGKGVTIPVPRAVIMIKKHPEGKKGGRSFRLLEKTSRRKGPYVLDQKGMVGGFSRRCASKQKVVRRRRVKKVPVKVPTVGGTRFDPQAAGKRGMSQAPLWGRKANRFLTQGRGRPGFSSAKGNTEIVRYIKRNAKTESLVQVVRREGTGS